ncbi:MAG TPA: MaoC family dehydratase [Bryobacteraceae bacterium]|jgi:acyl dehydratase|nr:MaoC family dehydratase [Bryobacteraceae bacterium]
MPARVVNGIDELKTLVGQELGASEWHVVTQEQIDKFAEVTGDNQWIHVDAERAKRESPYGAPIAHGFLTMSLLSGLTKEAVDIRGDYKMKINYGFNRLRFTGGVPAGSRVRAKYALTSVKDVEGGVEIAWGVTVEVEGQTKPALVAEWLGRTYY